MAQQVASTELEQIRTRLRQRAWVFDDPRSYRAGVDECFEALVALVLTPDSTPGISSPRESSGSV